MAGHNWRHGWVPLTTPAALSKAHGSKSGASKALGTGAKSGSRKAAKPDLSTREGRAAAAASADLSTAKGRALVARAQRESQRAMMPSDSQKRTRAAIMTGRPVPAKRKRAK